MRIRVEKRLEPSRAAAILVPVLSLFLALVLGGILLALVGANPIETYKAMLVGAFGSRYAISETLVKAVPLMLTGLGVSIAFRMLFWNIGGEGQLAMGGFATAGFALFVAPKMMTALEPAVAVLDGAGLDFLATALPRTLALAGVIAAGFVGGALWGLVPALLKAYVGVNEIIVTLMMNYIAILWVEYLFYGPWKDPQGYGFPGTAEFANVTWLPRFTGTRVNLGLIIAVVAAFLIWILLNRTKWGYEIRVIGENPAAAKYAGINRVRNIVLVMILSAGLCGLAGMTEVAGISHRLQKGLTVGYGYTAIIVAWLAKLNPWGVLIVAFLLAGLLVGGDQIQITMGLPASVALVLQGIILFLVLGGDILTQYRVVIERPAGVETTT
jgi:simple sugar transport system permease protein